jgi:peptidoglycan hydrolase-like protein with peptidoglycan-binding domain
MKFSTQAAVAAALAASLLAAPAFAQSQFNPPPAQHRQGPTPPTGTQSEYRAPASGAQATQQRPMSSTMKSARSASVRELQSALNAKGGATLKVDGKMGPQTREALRKYQSANGLQASGRSDAQTRAKLGISSSSTSRAIAPAKPKM